jgi:hypothetical protein
VAVRLDLGCCSCHDLEIMEHQRYYGLAHTDDRGLSLRVRSLHDVLFEPTNFVIDSLPATPMFLVASYSPAFYKINAYFHPSQW